MISFFWQKNVLHCRADSLPHEIPWRRSGLGTRSDHDWLFREPQQEIEALRLVQCGHSHHTRAVRMPDLRVDDRLANDENYAF